MLSVFALMLRRWRGSAASALAALLTGRHSGGAVTLRSCDVGAVEDATAATCCADAVLHAGGVLRVIFLGLSSLMFCCVYPCLV